MSALKKPVSPVSETAPDKVKEKVHGAGPVAADTVFAAATPAQAVSRGFSPVHVLQGRIEAAFSRANERRTLRISTMVLVMSLSLWMAALMLQAG